MISVDNPRSTGIQDTETSGTTSVVGAELELVDFAKGSGSPVFEKMKKSNTEVKNLLILMQNHVFRF